MTLKPVVLSLRHFSIVLLIIGIGFALLAFQRVTDSPGVINVLIMAAGVIAAMFGLQSLQTRQGVTVLGASQHYFKTMSDAALSETGLSELYRPGRGFGVIRHCYTHKKTANANAEGLLSAMKSYSTSHPQHVSLDAGTDPEIAASNKGLIAACAASLAVVVGLLAWLLHL